MSDTAELLRRGIAAAKAGQNKQARDLLTQVVELDESNEQAWLWLSGLVESLDDRRLCLENVLAVNPGNVHAQTGLRRIEAALARSSGEGKGFGQESIPPSSTPAPPAGDGAGAPLLREREGSEQRSIVSSPQPSPPHGRGCGRRSGQPCGDGAVVHHEDAERPTGDRSAGPGPQASAGQQPGLSAVGRCLPPTGQRGPSRPLL